MLPRMARRLPIDKLTVHSGRTVETVDELRDVIAAGALAVSTSRQELWAMPGNRWP